MWSYRQWMSCRPRSACRWRCSPWWRRCRAGRAAPGSSTRSRRGRWCRWSSRRSPLRRSTGPRRRRMCSPAPGGAPRCRGATGAARSRESSDQRWRGEAWIISHIRHDITHQWWGSGRALVSVMVSWVTWWHFSPQSQRLDDTESDREKTGENWDGACRLPILQIAAHRNNRRENINWMVLTGASVSGVGWQTFSGIITPSCIVLRAWPGIETIRMQDDGDRAETGQWWRWRVEMASRKTGCPSPGDKMNILWNLKMPKSSYYQHEGDCSIVIGARELSIHG